MKMSVKVTYFLWSLTFELFSGGWPRAAGVPSVRPLPSHPLPGLLGQPPLPLRPAQLLQRSAQLAHRPAQLLHCADQPAQRLPLPPATQVKPPGLQSAPAPLHIQLGEHEAGRKAGEGRGPGLHGPRDAVPRLPPGPQQWSTVLSSIYAASNTRTQ